MRSSGDGGDQRWRVVRHVWGLVKGCARLEVIVQALVIDFPLNIDDFIDGIVAGFNAVVWES
jgi:hypothetical protein